MVLQYMIHSIVNGGGWWTSIERGPRWRNLEIPRNNLDPIIQIFSQRYAILSIVSFRSKGHKNGHRNVFTQAFLVECFGKSTAWHEQILTLSLFQFNEIQSFEFIFIIF